jgi:hypothetical protein
VALQPSPLLRGFEQGADGTDQWNRMMPGEERGPLTLDPQGVALGQQFQAIKAGIEAQQARPIWNPDNPVGTETTLPQQSMGMPGPTTYAGPVGQFIDPTTGRMTEQGAARMGNPALGFDTGGIGATRLNLERVFSREGVGTKYLDNHTYAITHPDDGYIGMVDTTWNPGSKELFVNGVSADKGANSLGPSAVRQLRDSLLEQYPGAKILLGDRISGAGAGRVATQKIEP